MAALTQAQIQENTERVVDEFVTAMKEALAGGERELLTAIFAKHCKTPAAIAAFTSTALGIAFNHICALTRRCAQLESRPQLEHRGSWSGLEAYPAASLVTCGGSLWLATSAPPLGERPGNGKTSWRLVVKSGTAQ